MENQRSNVSNATYSELSKGNVLIFFWEIECLITCVRRGDSYNIRESNDTIKSVK